MSNVLAVIASAVASFAAACAACAGVGAALALGVRVFQAVMCI